MKISTFIAATVVAGAAGVIAGTYFTTGKGSSMARKGMLYKDYLMDNFYDHTDSVSHPFDNLEVETIRLSKKGEAKAEVDNV